MQRCAGCRCLCLCFIVSIFQVTIISSQCDRLTMVRDYETHYLGSVLLTTDLGWDGDIGTCKSGKISDQAIALSMMRINYFRRLAGISNPVFYDPGLEKMCQEAALMMHAQNDLAHQPDSQWTCFSPDGLQAAMRSNLALGVHGTAAISLYMLDPGMNNSAVGHRRWILYSRAKEFGLGSTSNAHALYVIHTKTAPPPDLEYIAYPSAGFFPAPLLPDRWSLGLPHANFTMTKIQMKDQFESEIALETMPLKNGFGDNTIVWEPMKELVPKYGTEDLTYQVYLTDVLIDDDTIDIRYAVTIAPVDYPPVCTQNAIWDEEQCACVSNQSTAAADVLGHLELQFYPNPAKEILTLQINESSPTLHVSIYSITGDLLTETSVQDKRNTIDVSQLPSGTYLLQMFDKRSTLVKRLVIAR